MIDIKEISKKYEKNEFIKEIILGCYGKFETGKNCPECHGLKSFEGTDKCDPVCEDVCEECWSNAVKDIKFKDDIEGEVNE